MNELAALVGARLQRIDAPHPDLLALGFYLGAGRGKGVVAVWLPRGGTGQWTWLDERPRGAPATAWVQQLRKHLGGRRVTRVTELAGEIALEFGPDALQLTASPANAVLVVDGQVRGQRHRTEASPGGILTRVSATELLSRLEDAEHAAARELQRLARRRAKSLRRRLRAIEGDIDAVEEAARFRHQGALILAHLNQAVPGATEIRVLDWNQDPPRPRSVPIRPGRSAKEEAEALFRKARKRERGGEIALVRHEMTVESLARLDRLIAQLEQPGADLEELTRALEKEGARPQRPAAHRAGGGEARLPFHRIEGAGGREIRVGRSAPENDALTLHHAKPWDHWLHARGVPGSHVVIPLTRNERVPDALLLDAAHLAAHFSRLRGEAVVEIQHAARRHVVKPRGSAPGAVLVRKEEVLVLRLEPARLQRLLGRLDLA